MFMATADELEELDAWISSLSTPEDDARCLLDTARARGAKIKKGKHTDQILQQLLVPLMVEIRKCQTLNQRKP